MHGAFSSYQQQPHVASLTGCQSLPVGAHSVRRQALQEQQARQAVQAGQQQALQAMWREEMWQLMLRWSVHALLATLCTAFGRRLWHPSLSSLSLLCITCAPRVPLSASVQPHTQRAVACTSLTCASSASTRAFASMTSSTSPMVIGARVWVWALMPPPPTCQRKEGGQ